MFEFYIFGAAALFCAIVIVGIFFNLKLLRDANAMKTQNAEFMNSVRHRYRARLSKTKTATLQEASAETEAPTYLTPKRMREMLKPYADEATPDEALAGTFTDKPFAPMATRQTPGYRYA